MPTFFFTALKNINCTPYCNVIKKYCSISITLKQIETKYIKNNALIIKKRKKFEREYI